MAEKTVLVCDVCGEPASHTITIHTKQRRMTKDLCSAHLAELTRGTRPVRRGRPRTTLLAKAKSARAKSTKRPVRRGRPARKKAAQAA
jgi:hypothetical protein